MHASGDVRTRWEERRQSREEAALELESIGKEGVSPVVLKAVEDGADRGSSQQKVLRGKWRG